MKNDKTSQFVPIKIEYYRQNICFLEKIFIIQPQLLFFFFVKFKLIIVAKE